MMNQPTVTNGNLSPLAVDFMPRPRLDRLFAQAAHSKLVYVVAGAGYGKTQAVHHYIEKQPDAVVRWVQLTESDNIGSRYWENLTHNVSSDNPDLARRLREMGFPDTLARFKQFAEILRATEHRAHKTYLVLDDFHLIHTKEALIFAERCAHLQIPGACVIIMSRKEPEINAVSLYANGKASTITEDELRFTVHEITEYLKRCGITCSATDLLRFSDATKGWALAIKLLSLVLRRVPYNLDLALDAMRQNIFHLFEMEAWSGLSEHLKKTMVRLPLVSDLPLVSLREILDDDAFTSDPPAYAPFVWFDSFSNEYRIHPLYLEFLQSKQFILSDDEKQNIYRRAAQWCSENGFFMDAIHYYAKSYQYGRMLEALLSYPFKLPYNACAYFLNILEALDPTDEEQSDYNILLLKNLFMPLLYMGMNRYEEARERSFAVIRKWENLEKPIAAYLLYTAYSNLAYIDMYVCTVSHHYDFPDYLKKAVEFYKASSSPPVKVSGPFAVTDVRSFACLVGENAGLPDFDQFVSALKKAAPYVAETYHHMYYGYDDLAVCELAFFRNQLDHARGRAHDAILKAREKKQYGIEMAAQHYLLRMAIHDGDYPLVREILKQLHSHLDNRDFWNNRMLYDIITGSFYCHIGLPKMAPLWLAVDEKEPASEARVSARELIVSVRYYLASHKYQQALTILINSYPREPQERFYFGELIFTLLLAAARLLTGDAAGAADDFVRAYGMSFNGEFEMPFIELGKTFHPLAAAVSKRGGGGIPEQWLTAVGRKATIYAKKTAVIIHAFKREKNIKDTVQLSERELEILSDLYHGLSREEIAVNRYLSINTVKKILQSIYIKLDANNNVDAVRIAVEKKIIE